MQTTHKDFKKGVVKLRITDADDFWYLSHIIEPGDFVRGKTTRKMKIGEGENAKTVKKTLTLTIEAETIELANDASSLRINGKIREGPDDLPKDHYHAISLEINSDCTLTKPSWLSYHKQRLKESCEQKFQYLVLLLDRDEALFALTKKFGYEVIVKLSGEVAKKTKEVQVTKDFYGDIIKAIETYDARYKPQAIIIASPAFYKEDLLKNIKNEDLRKKVVLATCHAIKAQAIDEVLKRPELADTLKASRAREEQLLVDELLKQINKDDRAAYGKDDTKKAIEAGAVKDLIITDKFIHIQKEAQEYKAWDELLKTVDSLQGKIHIIASNLESGARVDGLGGVAAILRYKL